MKVSLLPPALVLQSENIGENNGGIAQGPIVRIREKYWNDEGILKHELEHVKQFWVFGGLAISISIILLYSPFADYAGLAIAIAAGHPLLYMRLQAYRLWAEVSAYKVQLKYYAEDRTKMFAGFISKYYNLDISEEAAERLLEG
jgi:hypothetical protein